jgi:gliding motility-associated-like protein
LKGQGTTDMAYMLAPLNGTSFTITSASATTSWLINADETYSINISDPITYIKADKPVYMMHVSGYGCKLSGAQVTPAYCAGSYTTVFTRLSTDSLNLNLYTRAGFQNSFTLTSNGSPLTIPATAFTVVPGSSGDLVAARIYFPASDIAVGSHNILSNSRDIFGLGVHNGGSTGGSAYAYTTQFAINSFVYANALPTATICANTQFSLNGFIGGGPITGVWSFNGFGSLTGPNNQLTNNIYVPNPVDTNIRPVKVILTSTGICPNVSDTLRLTVKQPAIVTAGSNSIICSNSPTVNLGGNVYGATHQGIWSVGAPGNGTFTPGINTFTPTYLLSNTDTSLTHLQFILTSTNNAGCNPESSTVTVTISKPPIVIASAVNPLVRCANNATVFLSGVVSGTTTSTGMWQTAGSGAFIPNNLSLISNYLPSNDDISTGNVWLKLTSTNNLQCFPISDSVNVIFSQPASVSAGFDINTCVNNPYAILAGAVSGTTSSTGIWLGGAGTFSPANTVLTPTYVASATEVATGSVALTFSSTNNGICNGNSDQVVINFKDKPIANFSVNAVCLNQGSLFRDQSVNISGINGEIKDWLWDFGEAQQPLSILENPSHQYGSAGTYTAQLIVRSNYNCYDTVEKPVRIYGLPVSDFNLSRSCNGSAQLIAFRDASSITALDSISPSGYYWDFGGFGISQVKDTSIVFPSAGIYNITHIVTSNFGCKAIITKSVTISPRPVARFVYINNSVKSLGASVEFRDTSQYSVSWNWDFGNGETSNLKYPETFYKENGTYTVSLIITDQFGCPSTYTSALTITSIVTDITKLIPNVITPNNDGKNDYWRLDFIQVFFPEAEVEIYNRWGDRLFRSVGYYNAWDGSYKGDPLPVGAYYYIIKLNDKDNTAPFKGSVTLIK